MNNIKCLRKALNMSGSEFGSIIGVNKTTISRYERKEIKIPTKANRKIIETFGINMELFDDELSDEQKNLIRSAALRYLNNRFAKINIRNYLENPDKEVLRCAMINSKTYDEVYEKLSLLKSNEVMHYEYIIRFISKINYDIERARSSIAHSAKRCEFLIKFKNSEIGQLIEDFCREKTDEKLCVIKDKISNGCGFNVYIRGAHSYEDDEDENPYNSEFVIHDEYYHWYHFNNYNIDEDIKSLRQGEASSYNAIADYQEELAKIKSEIGEYDFDWLLINVGKYYEYGRRIV